MLSELATNAVQHAATAFEVDRRRRARAAPSVRVARQRQAPGATPPPRSRTPDAPHGRGLHIVRTLADAWGIEMRRDQPGKTVWFTVVGSSRPAPVPSWCGRSRWGASAGTTSDDGAALTVGADGTGSVDAARRSTPWPDPRRARRARRAARRRGGHRRATARSTTSTWRPKSSWAGRTGRSWAAPPSTSCPTRWPSRSDAGFGHFIRIAGRGAGRPEALRGDQARRRLRGRHRARAQSIFEHPLAGTVVVGIFRPRDDRKLQRWSELTSELLEILGDAPIDDPPAERLLSTLGRRLDWDVTTLWALAATTSWCAGTCGRAARPSRPPSHRRRPPTRRAGARGCRAGSSSTASPSGCPTWRSDWRFATDALAQDGLRSAYAFPIRYRGACVGVVKMLSRAPARARSIRGRAHGRRRRPPRRVAARVGPGGRARAAARRAARGAAAQRVPAAGHPGALRGRRLPRDGRAPGPGLRARARRPVPHRHRRRGRADAPHGGLARRPGQAVADRGAAHDATRPIRRARTRRWRSCAAGSPCGARTCPTSSCATRAGTSATTRSSSARFHLVHDGAAAAARRDGSSAP